MENSLFPSKSSFAVFVWMSLSVLAVTHLETVESFLVAVDSTISQSLNRLYQLTDTTPSLPEMASAIVPMPKAAATTKIPTDDLQCMAENIFFEAGTQSYAGKIAVGQVVLNRVKMPEYPRSVCGVIYEGSQSLHTTTCQFSWTCSPKKAIDKTSEAWYQSVKAARELLTNRNNVVDITEGATSYHANYVRPAWAKRLKLVATIDAHLFYSLPR